MRLEDRLLLSGFCGGAAAVIANLFLYVVNAFLPGYIIKHARNNGGVLP